MLEELYAGALADATSRSQIVSISDLERLIDSQLPALNPIGTFRSNQFVSVIAEIKRASPSKGLIAPVPRADELAGTYQDAGATAISVLTEGRKFLGSLDDLDSVRKIAKIPLLRKDFIANEYQVLEARAHGADMILLIVAGLNQPHLQHLYGFASELGMTCLVETHSRDEVLRAIDLGAQLIGINARDLSSFETDRNLFGELSALLPQEVIAVAESAVRNQQDVIQYASFGAEVVLVGEALVTGDTANLLKSLCSVPKIRI